MGKIGEILVKLMGTAVAGAVGASVVVLAIDGGDFLGAASGKKLAKNKKQSNVSIWSDVATEVNKEQKVPQAPAPQNPQVNLVGAPNIQSPLDDAPLFDTHDPVKCEGNKHTENGAIFSRTFMKGEVRAFHQDFGILGVVCSVDIYPQGCEAMTTFEIRSPGSNFAPAATSLCDRLAETFQSRRTVYVQGEKYIKGVDGYVSDYYQLKRFSGMPQGLDAFVARSNELNAAEQANREALEAMIGAGNSIGSKLGAAAGKAASNLGK